MSLAHHELCFGCGNANLFGLQMELEPADGRPGAVTGRFFLKQDHQGAPGLAHPGVVASALEEAMAIALRSQNMEPRLKSLDIRMIGDPPVGVFLRVDAHVEGEREGELLVNASAREVGGDGREAAVGRGRFELARARA